MAILERVRRAFNAFTPTEDDDFSSGFSGFNTYGSVYSSRPDRVRTGITNERSIITSIYTRIAIDAASIDIRHVELDDQNRYLQDRESGLNTCLTVEANLDQAARAFRQDIIYSMCSTGVSVVVPVDTSLNPRETGSYDILTMRVGEVVAWYPKHIRVSLYNENSGKREEITVPKHTAAIVENPLFAVMNEPNSTLQRLVKKLALLDAVDEQSASGKLDLIIQLPYVIKSDARRQQAEQRRSDIEFQLKGSKYGIAYTDGTEKITQLNRPAENNLLGQVEFLTKMLYGQLGITEEVMNGTADEKAMLNYRARTIEPMIAAVAEEFKRKFLTRTARSQRQSIMYFQDPFKLVPISQIADIADKFARNEITSSNEIRQAIGMRPSGDPKADQLVNANMPQGTVPASTETDPSVEDDSSVADEGPDEFDDAETLVNDAFDAADSTIDEIFNDLGVDEETV